MHMESLADPAFPVLPRPPARVSPSPAGSGDAPAPPASGARPPVQDACCCRRSCRRRRCSVSTSTHLPAAAAPGARFPVLRGAGTHRARPKKIIASVAAVAWHACTTQGSMSSSRKYGTTRATMNRAPAHWSSLDRTGLDAAPARAAAPTIASRASTALASVSQSCRITARPSSRRRLAQACDACTTRCKPASCRPAAAVGAATSLAAAGATAPRPSRSAARSPAATGRISKPRPRPVVRSLEAFAMRRTRSELLAMRSAFVSTNCSAWRGGPGGAGTGDAGPSAASPLPDTGWAARHGNALSH
mmetsp:Transcript_106095/g.300163  ORF Transcript_106095/g.300163 Transcript_106095/m.300163 type:complete len:304 (+) Transcript_106095:88-999(+)